MASALGNSVFTITGGTIDNTSGSLVTLNNNAQNWNASFTFTGTNDLNLGTGAVTMNASRQVTVTAGTSYSWRCDFRGRIQAYKSRKRSTYTYRSKCIDWRSNPYHRYIEY